MSTRLVILGILREKPLHGYQIKQIIEQRMGDWTSIAFGSIYFALAKLSEEGLVKMVETRQEGNRPSRSIYAITARGRKEFLRLLRAAWVEVERQHYAVDLGIAFKDALPQREIKEHLGKRVATLEQIRGYISRHRDEKMHDRQVPRWARHIFDHAAAHYETELGWTRKLLAEMERGK